MELYIDDQRLSEVLISEYGLSTHKAETVASAIISVVFFHKRLTDMSETRRRLKGFTEFIDSKDMKNISPCILLVTIGGVTVNSDDTRRLCFEDEHCRAELVTLHDIENALSFLKRLVFLIQRSSEMGETVARNISRDGIQTIASNADISQFADNSILFIRDKDNKLCTYVDTVYNSRANIRHAPDLDLVSQYDHIYARRSENVRLYAFKPEEMTITYFDGWSLLPDVVRKELQDLFGQGLIPLTHITEQPLENFSTILETTRSHVQAPGRTGVLTYNGKAVIGKSQSGDEYILYVKGIGPYDGSFHCVDRHVFMGTIGGEPKSIMGNVGVGYVRKYQADNEFRQLTALQSEPGSVLAVISIPVVCVSFKKNGDEFSIIFRCSPTNRRLGQFFWGTTIPVSAILKISETFGCSIASMLMEDTVVINKDLHLENISESTVGTRFGFYTNHGTTVKLAEQRRVFLFFSTYLTIFEERMLYRWNQYDRQYPDICSAFWKGFVLHFINVVCFPRDVETRLLWLSSSSYSKEAAREIVVIVWKYYIARRVVLNRDMVGYDPSCFVNATRDEVRILRKMDYSSQWVDEELELYDTVKRTLVSCDHLASRIINGQMDKLRGVIPLLPEEREL